LFFSIILFAGSRLLNSRRLPAPSKKLLFSFGFCNENCFT
jgi:hypothetical protein